jgi:hypothetical protein
MSVKPVKQLVWSELHIWCTPDAIAMFDVTHLLTSNVMKMFGASLNMEWIRRA